MAHVDDDDGMVVFTQSVEKEEISTPMTRLQACTDIITVLLVLNSEDSYDNDTQLKC